MAYVADEAGNILAAVPVAWTCDTWLQDPVTAAVMALRIILGNALFVFFCERTQYPESRPMVRTCLCCFVPWLAATNMSIIHPQLLLASDYRRQASSRIGT